MLRMSHRTRYRHRERRAVLLGVLVETDTAMKLRELITALEKLVDEGDAEGRERSYYEALTVRVEMKLTTHGAFAMFVINEDPKHGRTGVRLDPSHQSVIIEVRE